MPYEAEIAAVEDDAALLVIEAEEVVEASAVEVAEDLAEAPAGDRFIERDGERFASRQYAVDLFGANRIDNVELVEEALFDAAKAAGATAIRADVMKPHADGGVFGVIALAEGHICVRTWPQRAFAAVDICLGGEASPTPAYHALRAAFGAGVSHVKELRRGANV